MFKKYLSSKLFVIISLSLIIGVVYIYHPSFNFKFNLDDKLSSTQNKWAQEGFSGIDDIFCSPYLDEEDARYGGYRPIPRMSYAIEYGFWGNNPQRSHLINVLLYGLCCLMVFLFLRHPVFNNKIDGVLLLFAVAIFAFHPLHVEAVASLKNREVILAFIFGMLLIFVFLKENKNWLSYLLGFGLLLSGLFCKLDSIIFTVFIGLLLLFLRPSSWKKDFCLLVGMILLALSINYGIQTSFPKEINLVFTPEENPLVNVVGSSKYFSTVSYISIYLSRLVLIPNQQLFFYGAGKIDLVGWENGWVLFSTVFHLLIFLISVRLFYKKNVLGLFLMMYFACIGLNSNLVIPVPGIIADRLLFASILPFAGIIVYTIVLAKEKWKHQAVSYALMIPVLAFLLVSLFYSKNRVSCWESPYTLGQCDLPQLQNSIIAQTIYVKLLSSEIALETNEENKKHMINLSLAHSRRILELNPNSIVALNNIGSIYCEEKDSIAFGSQVLMAGLKLDSNHPLILKSLGNCFKESGDTENALKFYEAALKNADYNIKLRFDIFNIYLKDKKLKEAKSILGEMIQKAPNNKSTMIADGLWDIVNNEPEKATKKFEAVLKKYPEMTELREMVKAYYNSIEK